jgi:hypothetical protein
MKKENGNAALDKPSYKLTEQERGTLFNHRARKAAETAPRIKVLKKSDPRTISVDHPDITVGGELLAEALGTADPDFLNGLLRQLIEAATQGGELDESGINFMLAVIKGIKPNDQLEAMLAAQMAEIHLATLKYARQLARVETIQEQNSAERTLNKLARTFTTQMEALKRYRTGGEQKVTVQHVSVSDGGQAIVGNVTQAARSPR